MRGDPESQARALRKLADAVEAGKFVVRDVKWHKDVDTAVVDFDTVIATQITFSISLDLQAVGEPPWFDAETEATLRQKELPEISTPAAISGPHPPHSE